MNPNLDLRTAPCNGKKRFKKTVFEYIFQPHHSQSIIILSDGSFKADIDSVYSWRRKGEELRSNIACPIFKGGRSANKFRKSSHLWAFCDLRTQFFCGLKTSACPQIRTCSPYEYMYSIESFTCNWGLIWDRVVEYFLEGFTICGLIIKICGFAICVLAHLRNLLICDLRILKKICACPPLPIFWQYQPLDKTSGQPQVRLSLLRSVSVKTRPPVSSLGYSIYVLQVHSTQLCD